MKMFIRFSYHFLIIVGRLQAVFLALTALVVISAVVISQIENRPFGETLYFTFITGLTIGYGDIVVKTPFARPDALESIQPPGLDTLCFHLHRPCLRMGAVSLPIA